MALPFTAEQFFGVFRASNATLWPVQKFLLALAGMAVPTDASSPQAAGAVP